MVKEDALDAVASTDLDDAAPLVRVLCEQVGQKRFDAWFQGVAFDLAEPQVLRVVVGSSLERDCLRKHFKAELRDVCVAAGLGKRRVEFVVQASNEAAPAPRRSEAPSPAKSQAKPAAGGGLERVIPGEHNRQALALVDMITRGELTPSPAVLWGPSGCGKTRLLHALRDEARKRNRKLQVICLTAEEFTSGFVNAVHARSLPSFRGRHRTVDLLLIDDAHFLLGKQKTLEELQYTLDTLSSQGSTVVLTSDRSPSDLRRIGGELLSRLGGGVAVEISPPGFEAKKRLVEHFAQERGLPLELDAAKLIAAGVIGGAWELRGVVNKLHLMWRLMGQDAQHSLIQQTVDDINRISTPSVKITDILNAVCRVFGLESAAIKSTRRTKSITEPRMLAMWLARKYTHAAWSEIGESFGRRSHSTVISACRRVEDMMQRRASVHVPGGRCELHEAVRLVETQLRSA